MRQAHFEFPLFECGNFCSGLESDLVRRA